jgi:hypothetical protein
MSVYVVKHGGRKGSVHFDKKITSRISKLCYYGGLDPTKVCHVSVNSIVAMVVVVVGGKIVMKVHVCL